MLTTAGFHEPAMPLALRFGNGGAADPEQIVVLVPKPKEGVTFGFTVCVYVNGVAHWPAVGVKIYVPELLGSTVVGLQVPVTPFIEVVGNDGPGAPAHTEAVGVKVKVGLRVGVTATVNVVPVIQPVPLGVNIYVPELLGSTTAGDHVPEIPFKEVVGKTGTGPIAPQKFKLVPKANVGTVLGITVTFTVTDNPQVPLAGVNWYDPEAWLLITAGDHVPAIPFCEMAGNDGAGVPAQNGGIAANNGTNIGSLSTTPVRIVDEQPFAVKIKFEYMPLSRPVRTNWPDPFADKVTGPAAALLSVKDIW